MSNDGIVQVPPDSTGPKIDGASVGVAGNTVIRQRIVIADNSASAQFATITANALLVQVNNAVAVSGTPSVVLAAGTANIGTLNGISATVNVVGNLALTGAVAISGTATMVVGGFLDGSGQQRNVVDSANTALRVNIVAGNSTGVSQTDDTSFSAAAAAFVPIGGVWADSGTGMSLSASHAGAVRMTGFRALHVNLRNAAGAEISAGAPLSVKVENLSATISSVIAGFRDLTGATVSVVDAATAALRIIGAGTGNSINIGSFIDASGSTKNLVDSTTLALRVYLASAPATANVVLAAGTANFGTLNDISRTVQVAIGTPFTVNNISRTVTVVVGTPFTIDAISATVTVTTANPYVVNTPSASHGPRMVQVSTSATATFIAAPGAGLHVYITHLAVSNAGTVLTQCQIGTSASLGQITMIAAANGGGFVLNFDPPYKVQSNEAVLCRVDPNPSGNCHFNANYYVAA